MSSSSHNKNIGGAFAHKYLDGHQSRKAFLQKQLIAGTKLISAIDNPAESHKMAALNDFVRRSKAALFNANDALNVLKLGEQGIELSKKIMRTVNELIIQYKQSDESTSDKIKIMDNVKNLMNEICCICNMYEHNTKKVYGTSTETWVWKLSPNCDESDCDISWNYNMCGASLSAIYDCVQGTLTNTDLEELCDEADAFYKELTTALGTVGSTSQQIHVRKLSLSNLLEVNEKIYVETMSINKDRISLEIECLDKQLSLARNTYMSACKNQPYTFNIDSHIFSSAGSSSRFRN